MECSSSSLDKHEWEPQHEDHRHGALTRQDIMLTDLVHPLTLSRSGNGPFFPIPTTQPDK